MRNNFAHRNYFKSGTELELKFREPLGNKCEWNLNLIYLGSLEFDGIWPGNSSIQPTDKNKFASNEFEVH
jgi:hypothetical protein